MYKYEKKQLYLKLGQEACDVLYWIAKMAWDVLSGVSKTAWDVLSGMANRCGMFYLGMSKNGMGCFVLGCFVIHSDHCSNVIMNRIFKIILQIIRFPLLEKRIDYDVISIALVFMLILLSNEKPHLSSTQS